MESVRVKITHRDLMCLPLFHSFFLRYDFLFVDGLKLLEQKPLNEKDN